ncbi:hypothetical protein AYO45_01920 [Gammaproteobacteria bacterium SCGC AG-212-F23]|nr:hypothetical protein AYO45_01920 [Gammaproteobacteria bacterium SCGC AG-212-F23]
MIANIMTYDDLDAYRQEALRKDQEKRRIEQIEQYLEKVPLRFKGKTFNDYHTHIPTQTRIKEITERFSSTFSDRLKNGCTLKLLGNPGTGKTLLSLIMYQTIAKMGYSVHYEPSLLFLKTLQEKRYESYAAYQAFIDFYKRVHFLVLDEITEAITKDGAPSEMERKLLFDVINARYELKERCTVVISNRNATDLANRIGQSTDDRLSENGILLVFNWDTYRKK